MSASNGNGTSNGGSSVDELDDNFDPTGCVYVHQRRDDRFAPAEDDVTDIAGVVLDVGGRLSVLEKKVDSIARTGARNHVDTMEGLSLLSADMIRSKEGSAAAALHFETRIKAAREEQTALGAQVGKVAAEGVAARSELASHGDLVEALAKENAATKVLAEAAHRQAQKALVAGGVKIGAVVAGVLGAIASIDAAYPWLHPIVDRVRHVIF